MSSITNLVATTALTDVKYEQSDHSKYIITLKFNKLTAENSAARLTQAKLASKMILLIA